MIAIVDLEEAIEKKRRLARIKFSYSSSRRMGDRIHWITPDEIRVLLSRLPFETWTRLRTVHFNDQWRYRTFGYVNRGTREITICALPPRISLSGTMARLRIKCPRHFGAKRNTQWPDLAIRRFMLYEVFLHELGHLQLVRPNSRSERLKFARETLAQEFADYWREKLWSEPFDHLDPVHNPPGNDEFDACQA